MSTHRSVDAITAIAEEDATGFTASIFEEIRAVMQIPTVTSIWRTLDAVPGGLEEVWKATRPMYLSGWPDEILNRMYKQINFPKPAPLTQRDFNSIGLSLRDCTDILNVLDAYNRSNSLNLIALTAFCTTATETARSPIERPPPRSWPYFPALIVPENIDETGWRLLDAVSLMGLQAPDPNIPTLWRHLLRWPAFVQLLVERFHPLQESGSLLRVVDEVEEFAEVNAVKAAQFADRKIKIPVAAKIMVEEYVGRPPSVSRMVAVGNCVSEWFKASDQEL